MQISIDVPDSLPKARLQQRIKELEDSLKDEVRFLAEVKVIVDTVSNKQISSNQQIWLGSMSDTGEIIGDIL